MARRYVVDPDDPRAPPQDVWERMTADERAELIASLPSDIPRVSPPPEGDLHWEPKATTLDTLRQHFRRIGRRVYLAAELPVYYPAEPMFAPDLIAVRDVELHPRSSWMVSHETRGLDLALEIHVAGDRRKDFELNVERFARLGIPEYFAFDVPRGRLVGWRLATADARRYETIAPRDGRWASAVLELELAVERGRLRFFHGTAPVLDSQELIARLGNMVDDAVRRAEDEARRAKDEARRAKDEARRAKDEARRAEHEVRRAESEARRADDEARRAESEARRADDESRRAEAFAQRLRELGVDPDTVK